MIRFDNGVGLFLATRLTLQYYQQVKPILDKTRVNDAGEVSGLYHANYILSKRFPRRLRPYFAHAPKVITRSLHHEASLMFESHLTTSSQRRFREVHHGQGDIQMQWLLSSLRVRPGRSHGANDRSSAGEKRYCGHMLWRAWDMLSQLNRVFGTAMCDANCTVCSI